MNGVSATADTATKDAGRTKISEARMYSPSVASSEMTMFRKIELVKSESGVNGPSFLMMLSTPLKAKKNAEI